MPAPLTLVCLPCAGASATMFLRWRRALPAWIQLLPLELPGRGARMDEAPATRFAPLAAQLLDELMGQLRGPYVLFGHSMGALLAHGMYEQGRARGLPAPLALLVSACAAPSMRDPERFANLDTDAQLIADMRRQGGTPEELFKHPELLRMTLDVLAADYRVCRDFSADGAPAAVPVHVFGGREDEISAAQLEAWRGTAAFSLDWFDGGHFYLKQQELFFLRCLEGRLHALRQAARDAVSVPA